MHVKECFYIDLLGGKLSLTTKLSNKLLHHVAISAIALDETPTTQGDSKAEINFDYREALAHPGDPVTMRFSDGQVIETSRLKSLAVFIRYVEIVTGQDFEFSQNVAWLIQHERAYCDAFLAPDVNGMSKFRRPRAEANDRGRQLETDQERHDEFKRDMRAAAKLVHSGKYDEAVAIYEEAAKL